MKKDSITPKKTNNPMTRTEQNIVISAPLGLPEDDEVSRIKRTVQSLDSYAVIALDSLAEITQNREVDEEGRPLVRPEVRANAAKGILTAGSEYAARRFKMLDVVQREETREVMTFDESNRIATYNQEDDD